nr:Opt2.2 [Starmerella bombicola]
MSSTSSILDGAVKSDTVVSEKVRSGEKAVNLDHLHQVEHFSDGSFSENDLEIIASHIDDYTIEEAREIITEAIAYHDGDSSVSVTYYNHLLRLVQGPYGDQSADEWEALLKFDAFLIHDWSIYPMVRAVTRPIDEEEYENYENIRVYLVSIIWSCAGSVLATFFNVRFPSISLSSIAVQILIAYTGKLLRYIPDFSFPIGFGRRVHFGGGVWNFKEQMLATCGMGVGNTFPYSQYAIIAMANDNFYGFDDAKSNFGFNIMLTLSSNLMGFGLAGLFRVFLVYPSRMIWYGVLPTIKLSRSLLQPEERENINGWRLKDAEFFWLFSFIWFGWYWITDFVFEFLGYFDWVAWISHKDNDMLSICSVTSGVGINPIPTFDWSIVTPIAMVSPFFSTASMLVGMVISSFILIGIFYTNISWTSYLPINTNTLFANTGKAFNVSRILDSKHNLDEEKYQNYSMPFWSAGNLVSYGSFFALYPAMIMYSLLNHLDILSYSMKILAKTLLHPGKTLNSFNDRYTRAQRKYKEVPEWWYIVFLLICVGIGIATVEHYKFTGTPVWTIFFAIGLSAIFMVPSGVLYATTNNEIVINVLYELIIGLTVEGNGTALMISKVYATNFMSDTESFVSNLKTAHYLGIAPRAMFRLQIVSCIANSFVQSGLMVWQTGDSIPNMCNTDNTQKFTCQNQRTYFNAAVQWGTIGPKRVLRDLYPRMRWCFLLGALFPVPFWLVRRFGLKTAREKGWGNIKEGGSKLRNSSIVRFMFSLEWMMSMNELVVLSGGVNWAPYNFMYYWPYLYIGFFFQVYLPKYYPRWWRKYNYLLYAAITVGYSYSALIMFFATSYHHIASIDWWGNDAAISLSAGPRLPVPASGTFGPKSWR